MLLVTLVNSFVVAVAVLIHYDALYLIAKLLPKLRIVPRYRILLGVFGALIAHAVEVWLFAFAFYYMHHHKDWGQLTGNFTGTLLDCSYFSFTTYTTLGFGDIQPVGHMRYLTGIESLTGLVLITWTASFLYIEMEKYWRIR